MMLAENLFFPLTRLGFASAWFYFLPKTRLEHPRAAPRSFSGTAKRDWESGLASPVSR
jgi:hypothetical protein